MEFYHGKNHSIWSYCISLGGFISENGRKYDLGIFEETWKDGSKHQSFAIVYGKEDSHYISGDILDLDHEFGGWGSGDFRTETIKRYKEYLAKKEQA